MTAPMVDYKIHWLKMMSVSESRAVVGRHDGINGRDRFLPRSCRPYRAQTKGKVERPIRYIRESFFYGRSLVNDDDLNE